MGDAEFRLKTLHLSLHPEAFLREAPPPCPFPIIDSSHCQLSPKNRSSRYSQDHLQDGQRDSGLESISVSLASFYSHPMLALIVTAGPNSLPQGPAAADSSLEGFEPQGEPGSIFEHHDSSDRSQSGGGPPEEVLQELCLSQSLRDPSLPPPGLHL